MIATIGSRLRTAPLFLFAHVITWCVLWGEFSPGNILSGLLLGALISVLFPMPRLAAEVRFRPWAWFVLIAVFIKDVVVSSLVVGLASVRPGHHPHSSVVRVQLLGRSDLYLTVTADLLTLVPGSLVVETDREHGVLFMHFFDAHTPEQIARATAEVLAQEARVLKAFAPADELRQIGLRDPRSAP